MKMKWSRKTDKPDQIIVMPREDEVRLRQGQTVGETRHPRRV